MRPARSADLTDQVQDLAQRHPPYGYRRVWALLHSAWVIAVLEHLFRTHGAPEFLRSDNGPKFIALVLRGWLVQQHTETLYIDPGCPW